VRLGQGREAEVFAWTDGYVLKLFWPEFSLADAELEAHLTQQVWLLGAPAPRVEDLLEFEGRWGLVLEWIRGVSLTEYSRPIPTVCALLPRCWGPCTASCTARLPDTCPPSDSTLFSESSPVGFQKSSGRLCCNT